MPEAITKDFQKVASGTYPEGLAVDHERNVIWYSDVIAGGIHGVKPDGSKVTFFNPERMWTGGVMMNADGSVLSSGQGGIMWNHPENGKSGWLIKSIDGIALDAVGNVWITGFRSHYFTRISSDGGELARYERTVRNRRFQNRTSAFHALLMFVPSSLCA